PPHFPTKNTKLYTKDGFQEISNKKKNLFNGSVLGISPSIPLDDNNKPTRQPTAPEVQSALSNVDRGFFLLHSGQCVIFGPNCNNSIIAVLEVTPWDKLTKNYKINLDFVSTFLHGSKEFISPVFSKISSWGHKRGYLKFGPEKRLEYDHYFQKSSSVGEIIDPSDISDFAFVIFIPTFSSTGSLHCKERLDELPAVDMQHAPAKLPSKLHLMRLSKIFGEKTSINIVISHLLLVKKSLDGSLAECCMSTAGS
ncbi:hypothetical protein VP01_4527g1, partial [Puccinia sorghi]